MLHISEKFIAQIKQEAEKAYPNECCGFIFGSINGGDKYTENILACTNSTADSEQYHRFVITPEDMLKAERLARLIKADIIGFYHSHPDCAAVPSEYDRSHALPVYSYIIVSVINGRAEECTSWELDKDYDYKKFQSEYITVSKGDVK
ncbi:MAG: M67 family metallopeptidase [Porcipelethomonas sp.]